MLGEWKVGGGRNDHSSPSTITTPQISFIMFPMLPMQRRSCDSVWVSWARPRTPPRRTGGHQTNMKLTARNSLSASSFLLVNTRYCSSFHCVQHTQHNRSRLGFGASRRSKSLRTLKMGNCLSFRNGSPPCTGGV